MLALLTVDGETAGFAALVGSSSPLRRHWAMVLRVQVHPSRQGAGLGRVLMTAPTTSPVRTAGSSCRSAPAAAPASTASTGGLGYTEYGRLPGAIRVAPGDDRDEILLTFRL